MKFILGSQSPRRSQLLQEAGYKFEVISVNLSEILNKNLTIDEQIVDLARTKALATSNKLKSSKEQSFLILGADTVVVLGDRVFGKPKDQSEAEENLRTLSGKKHSVKTAICFVVLPSLQEVKAIDTSFVTFRKLSEDDIQNYLSTKEWKDKAGSYAIQGEGKKLVQGLEGSLTNVVGLPMELVERMLKENDWEKYCR